MQRSRSIATSGDNASGFSKCRLGSIIRLRPSPQPNVMSCSGHSPPLSQTGQSSGWLTSRNSTTAFWACLTRADWVSELGLVGEVWDLDVALLGGVDQHRVLDRLDLSAVDRQLDRLLFGAGH